MKIQKFKILTFLLLLVSFAGYCQKPGYSSNVELGSFISKHDLFSAKYVQEREGQDLNNISNPQVNNQIFISQVGEENYMSTRISSSNAIVDLKQKGNNNNLNIDLTASTIRYKLTQNGSNNIYEDFVFDPTAEVQVDIIMQGNNNSFKTFGSNSIGNKLQFNMTGNSKTILVRNSQ
ncbi:hypothetical protein [Salinimicrobium sp. GXAS 041]|uniref:hypothetical protein n=1 Tax=Salinimicrobium sp. GXAS 041 TaxID=3400806 RepID=UPI003C764188